MNIMPRLFFFLGLMGVLAQPLQAATDYPVTSSGVYFGARGSRIEWKAGCNKFFGYLIGPSVGIDYRKPSHVYGGYRFYWMFGHTSSGDCKRYMTDMDMQGRLGYTYGKTFLFTPYTGLGINATARKKQHVQTPCHRISYAGVYVPIGALISYHPSSKFSVGLDYQYMPQIDSYAKLSGFKNISFDLKNKGQHSVEIPIQFCYPKPRFHNVQYRIIPFFRTYAYGTSTLVCGCTCETNATINLPRQTAYEWGIRYEVAIW